MRLGIVGGALQGIEATYLAHKAGWSTLVLDRREDAPARSISDESLTVDVAEEPERAFEALKDCDAVIPAIENMPVLNALEGMRDGLSGPLMFDPHAYSISSSKLKSNEVMAEMGVPLPKPWPECGFPVIVKPSCQSGSVGVSEVGCEEEVAPALRKVYDLGDTPVIQEFVSGRSLSIEAVGDGRTAKAYITTEVVLDRGYDCKRVMCYPNMVDPAEETRFGRAMRDVSERIGLRGIMDMEAIEGRNGIRVLEIDARIPSQTPACILAGTGINLLSELYAASSGNWGDVRSTRRCSSYEHLWFHDGVLEETGEKQFSHVRGPRVESGLFGCDDAITDYRPGAAEWHGTFICSADDLPSLEAKRAAFRSAAAAACGVGAVTESSPEVVRRQGLHIR